MGMYTAFAFAIKVKPEYRHIVANMLKVFHWSNSKELDGSRSYDVYPFTQEYCSKYRATFIPYGSMETDIPNKTYLDRTPIENNRNNYDEETGEWEVGCSVNYGYDEIHYYLEKILPVITEKCYYIYDHYEEYDICNEYTIEDGELQQINVYDGLNWYEMST